ncbi:hypothetical protein AVEN_1791-1 [Araneus ventricosus]|uniref:Uncharacterized protein n=1 Tax=Araneus ventricosus TaxID=182803 RepID=A0A4Y2JX87_ARAVE|nr:hypothetical protein AVEN_1791-1 [Araneus ventricosus]
MGERCNGKVNKKVVPCRIKWHWGANCARFRQQLRGFDVQQAAYTVNLRWSSVPRPRPYHLVTASTTLYVTLPTLRPLKLFWIQQNCRERDLRDGIHVSFGCGMLQLFACQNRFKRSTRNGGMKRYVIYHCFKSKGRICRRISLLKIKGNACVLTLYKVDCPNFKKSFTVLPNFYKPVEYQELL